MDNQKLFLKNQKNYIIEKLIFFLFKILAALDLCYGTQTFSACRAWVLECRGSVAVVCGILVPD